MNRVPKNLLITVLVLLSAVAGYQAYVIFAQKASAPKVEATPLPRGEMDHSQHDMSGMAGMVGVSENTTTTTADQQKYNQIKDEYFNLVKAKDPAVSLALVEKRIETDVWLMDHCHALVHEIGHEAFKKYKNFDVALSYMNDTCNSGYMHGVIEQFFADTQDVFNAMKTMCDGFGNDAGRCYHGVGHGLMYYTANNLPKSLEYCTTLKGGDAVAYCSGGVFMENFNTDMKLHPSEYLDKNDPMYPCPGQKERFKLWCYYYAPTFYLALHNDDYASALAWCQTAEEGYRGTCVRGVSSRAVKVHISDPLWVEKMCVKSSPDRANCIDGMIGFYINHYDSLSKGQNLCDQLQPENQSFCYDGIRRRQSIFAPQD